MASKMVGALFLVLLLALNTSDAQVLPTPCCRIDCCDGKPQCCAPWHRPPITAVAPSTLQAPTTAVAPRKVLAGNSIEMSIAGP
jgi:hypothetical protein